jgi:hypothetical protein
MPYTRFGFKLSLDLAQLVSQELSPEFAAE